MQTTEGKIGQEVTAPVVKKPESGEDKSSSTGGLETNFGDKGTKGTGSAG
jgi:hypothetical protein